MRRLFEKLLMSTRQYCRVAHHNTTHRRRQEFYSLLSDEWRLLAAPPINFLLTLEQVDDAIDANADIAVHILKTALESFGLKNESPNHTPDWHGCATSADLDKARSTLRQFYRDWSAEGASERQASYGPVLHDFAVAFATAPDRADIKILVPGAGLGRLVFELCLHGYRVEGNEVSYHQLLASSWVLNETVRAEQYHLFPFAFDFSNTISRAHQLKRVSIPDLHPATTLAHTLEATPNSTSDRMNMVAADFSELYSSPNRKELFDAVATVFFLDTASNVIQYIRAVHNCLKPGGIWANHGPLLWHWADSTPAKDDDSNNHHHSHKREVQRPISSQGRVELSVEEVLMLIGKMGFQVESQEIRQEGCGYIQNPESMMQHLYQTSHWVARKM